MKILLLGATGQLGHELTPLLSRHGDLIALSHADLDVSDLAALGARLSKERPVIIVNATAYNEVDRAESEPQAALRLNAEVVAVLGAYAKRKNGALIHYSTDFVFDGKKKTPYRENDAPNPLSSYGRSKLAGERALEELAAPALVLRTAWVYSTRRKSFVSAILKLAREKKELKVVTDQVGSPTFCRDLARATDAIIERLGDRPGEAAAAARGVYHAAGEGACSRYELARAVLELDPKRSEHTVTSIEPVTADAFPAPAVRPAYTPLDCERLSHVFGVALAPWQEALAEALRD